jgi:hypothetical protein
VQTICASNCFRRGLAEATLGMRRGDTEDDTFSVEFVEDWEGDCWFCGTGRIVAGWFVRHRVNFQDLLQSP